MSETKRCPQCQAEIPAAAPEGLCPQCLLQAALEPKTADAEVKTTPYVSSGPGFVPPAPEALQAAFPHLEILDLLGKGGMGAVYKARQPGLDRLVAVKILPPTVGEDPAFAERFTREARALAMLNHPNIVGVYDSGRAGSYYYFVMEYLDGVNLRQAMRAGTLKSAEALKIVPQICEALQFAHDEGIVHRDIKPENILLDKKGRVKIADFGLAKLLGRTAPDVSLTGTQQVMGTMHYMAPEQLEGSRDIDHRADIYSLGVTFYEMLTGELPIGRFAPPSKKVQIDVRLDEVVLRSLEKAPELRYQHASEIKTDVEGIVRTPPQVADDANVLHPILAAIIVFVIWTGLTGLVGSSWFLQVAIGPVFVGMVAWLVWYLRKQPALAEQSSESKQQGKKDQHHPLEKQPAQRYQHASEIKTDVEGIAQSAAKEEHLPEPTAETKPTLEPRPRPFVGPWIVRVFGALNLIAAVPLFVFATIELQAVRPGRQAREFNDKIVGAHQRLNLADFRPDDTQKVLQDVRAEMKTWTVPPSPSAQDYYRGFGKYLDWREETIQNPHEIYENLRRRWGDLQRLEKAFTDDHVSQIMFSNPWTYVGAALNFLACFGLFAGGIGLLLCERWGWRTVVAIAMFQVIHLLVQFVVFVISSAFEQVLEASNRSGSANFLEVVAIAVVLIWFFLLAQIVILTRGNVRHLFRVLVKTSAATT